MQHLNANARCIATDQPLQDAEFRALISGMTCACAKTSAHADAPLAQALFHQVEEMRQPLALAARRLGVKDGDAAYLLAGLREDLAKDFVRAMLAERPAGETTRQKDIDDE